jgi:hypothetical protein
MNEQKSWYPTPVQRSMLDFMKESQPQLYAELRAEGTLQEHLRDYSHWYHDKVDMITEQMGGSANAAACAREIVRAMSFEGREPYE